MRGYRVIGLAFASLIGCRSFQDITLIDDGGTTCPSIDANPPADMATPPPKCAAAKGLAGDNLLCVDFKDVQTLSSLGGWDFNCNGGTS